MLGFGPEIPKISPRDALRGVRDAQIFMIDVRNPDEWAQTGVPEGSHRIALGDKDLVKKVKALVGQRDGAEIAISCLSGMRSRTAVNLLRRHGIERVKIVHGGITRWKADGLPVED